MKFLASVVSTCSTILLAFPAVAQISNLSIVNLYCYWIDGSGDVIDLTYMCGRGRTFANTISEADSLFSDESLEEVDSEGEAWDFEAVMQEEGYRSIITSRSTTGNLTFDVWGKQNGDFLFFIWSSRYGISRSEPDVIVGTNLANGVVNDDYIIGCFYSAGSNCSGDELSSARLEASTQARVKTSLGQMPANSRWENYQGNCLFPWQLASNGSKCGRRAAVIRPGGY